MDKRQDTISTLFTAAAWLTLSLMFILIGSACQTVPETLPAAQNPPNITPTASPLATHPNPTPTLTPTPPDPVPTEITEDDCLLAGGNVHSGSLFSYQLGEDLHYQIYLPPCYHNDLDKRYPVTYLLHGLTFNEEQWLRLGVADEMDALISQGSISPFIIIMPGEARFQSPQTSTFANALVFELIPWVDQQYRTQPEKAYRAIGGLSRGAAWSVHLGFEYPQMFSSVGAHSLPLFLYDGSRLNSWLTRTPVEELPLFFIDIGRADPDRQSAQEFADQLDARHIPHTWYLFNGGHTEAYWSSHLPLYLRWYARDW